MIRMAKSTGQNRVKETKELLGSSNEGSLPIHNLKMNCFLYLGSMKSKILQN